MPTTPMKLRGRPPQRAGSPDRREGSRRGGSPTGSLSGSTGSLTARIHNPSDRMLVGVRIRAHSSPDEPVAATGDEVTNTVVIGTKEMAFDGVFTGDQESIYAAYGRPMIEEAFNGYNTCLFAYGQTGSGKTYTLQGLPGAGRAEDSLPSRDHEGILPRFLRDLLTIRQERLCTDRSLRIMISLSIIEIYNEEIRDLLTNEAPRGKGLQLVEDPTTRQIVVQGVTEAQVEGPDHAIQLLLAGNNARKTAATLMNECSSRSHMVVQLHIQQRHAAQPRGLEARVKFVDLAGSECISRAGTEGARRIESGCINKSLLCLGKVLSHFSNGKAMGSIRGTMRESKLTRLLGESFGGNSKTRMLAMISPLSSNEAQTQSTLHYATSAKKIALHATQNRLREAETQKLQVLQQQLAALREENDALNDKLATTSADRDSAEARVVEHAQRNHEYQEEITALREALKTAQAERDEAKKELKAEVEYASGLRAILEEKEKDTKEPIAPPPPPLPLATRSNNQPAPRHRSASKTRGCSVPRGPTSKSRDAEYDMMRKRSDEARKESTRLNDALSKSELTKDLLKDEFQQLYTKGQLIETRRREALAENTSLESRIAALQKALREANDKNALLEQLLQKETSTVAKLTRGKKCVTCRGAQQPQLPRSQVGTPTTPHDEVSVESL